MTTTELIGYLASALLVASLAMTSVVRLRVLSALGSLVFIVYGVLTGAWPVVITNVATTLVNLWHLAREFGGHRNLGAIPVDPTAPFFVDFISSHHTDIRRTQPRFEWANPDDKAFMLQRDGLPAGLLVGHREGDEFVVDLDYVMEAYRDSRVGQWLYGEGAGLFRDQGVVRVVHTADTPVHRRYLDSVGFTTDDGTRYVKTLR